MSQLKQKIGKNTRLRENLGYIYAIFCPQANTVKIGVTAKPPRERLDQLQTGNPYDLFLIAYHVTEFTYDLEQIIHRYLQKFAYRGEWFTYDKPVAAFIYHNFRRICDPEKFDPEIKTPNSTEIFDFQKEMVDIMNEFYYDEANTDFLIEPLKPLE